MKYSTRVLTLITSFALAACGGNGSTDPRSTPDCTPGQLRCSGLMAQECDTTGAWVTSNTCAYTCTDGHCSGECTPGTGPACCQDFAVTDGSGGVRRDCRASISTCVDGPGCGDGHPLSVYLLACDAYGAYYEANDCGIAGSSVGGGPGAETRYATCGDCEQTGQKSCLDVDFTCAN